MKTKNFIDKIIDKISKLKYLNFISKIYYKYRQIWLYLFWGVVTTITNILIYFILANLININYIISTILAWLISILVAYFSNRTYVFESKTNNRKIKEFINFLISRLFTLLLDVVGMYIGISILLINDVLMKVLINILIIVANYIISKLFVFKNK